MDPNFSRLDPESVPVVYHIDGNDRVCAANAAWDQFALDNGSPQWVAAEVIGKSLWELLPQADIQDFYRPLVKRIRAGRTVTVMLRCDAPHRRRLIDLHLSESGDGMVTFASSVVVASPRAPIALLDPALPRTGEPAPICSWCNRVEILSRRWVEIEFAVQAGMWTAGPDLPRLHHVSCPDCVASLRNVLDSAG